MEKVLIKQEKIANLLDESRRKYKNLFDNNPVSLWEEDFSKVKQLLDKKKAKIGDLKKYFDENPDFIYECISKIKIIKVNKKTLLLLGAQSKNELIDNLSHSFTDKSLEAFKREFLAIASNKKEFSTETEFIRSDGEIITALIKFVFIGDNYENSVISLIDITELVGAKKKTEKSEKKFRELYEKSGDAILIIKNGIFIDCNQATVDLLKYKTKEEFLNTNPFLFSPTLQPDGKKSIDKAQEMIKVALKHGTHRFEWIHTKNNGINFPVEVLLTTIIDETNNKVIHCVWRDISKRKKIEELLTKSEEKFSKAFFNNPIPILISSIPEGKLIDINPMLEKLSGYNRNEMIGKKISDLGFYTNKEDRVKLFDQLKDKGKLLEHGVTLKMRDGELKDCLLFSEVIDIDGKRCLITILRDVTKSKKAELMLKQSERELRISQEIAQLGSYQLNFLTETFVSSPIFDAIVGLKEGITKTLDTYKAIVHPDDYDDNYKMLEECIKKSKGFDREYRIYTKNKKELKWIHGLGKVTFKEGIPTHFSGSIQDITLKKNAEQKLNKINRLYFTLSEINKAIITEENDLNLLKKICDISINSGKFRLAWIGLLDKKNMIINPTVCSSSDSCCLKDFRILLEQKIQSNELIARIINEYGSFVSNNIEKDSNFYPWMDKAAELGFRSSGIFPLKLHNKVIGVYMVYSSEESFFDYDEINLLEEASLNISFALEKIKEEENRKKVETMLKKSEKQLQKVHRIAKIGTFIFDYKTSLFETSQLYDEIVGIDDSYSKNDQGIKNFSNQQDYDVIRNFLFDDTQTTITKEYRIIRPKDNKLIWVLGHAKKEFNNQGTLTQTTGTIQDITLRKLNEEKIDLLNKALIQSPQVVIITSLKGEIEYINPAFTALSGYSEIEAIGQNARILKSDEHAPEFFEELWKTISKGNIWEGEFTNIHKDGSKYLVESNISSLKNEVGKITHFICVLEDITEKRKLERQFISGFIEAQEIEKQNFGEELHDGISQILSAESMYIDLLINKNQDRILGKAKFLTKVQQLNSMAVKEVRNVAHGLMSSQLKQKGLIIAVDNICIDFNSSKKINFSFTNKDVKEEELSKEIRINLFRVIQELSTNIIRYSSAADAFLSISKIDHNKLRLIVKDNGIGMDYNKIKKEQKVTGLQNVERRITFLNGTFSVKSSPNKGTCWEIIVPLEV